MSSVSFLDWVANFKGRPANAAGCSPLERLPTELLNRILLYVATPISRKGWAIPHALPGETTSRPTSLLSCIQASRRFHDLALYIMYRDPSIRTPKISSIMKFFETLDSNPQYRPLVRTFDITHSSHCNYTLSIHKLLLLPSIRDLRLSLSHVKDITMLHTLVFEIPGLESLTLDVSQLNSKTEVLRGAFDILPTHLSSSLTSLKFTDISGAGGLNIPGVLESLLPRMKKLRVLDMSRTCITSEALLSLPDTARLTHLNIWGCRDLDLDLLVEFLTTHSAVRNSLIVLKIGYIADVTTMTPLNEVQVNAILERAPSTLRSLDLGMANMGFRNLKFLQRMCCQLEELSVGRGLDMKDLENMLLKPRFDFDEEYREEGSSEDAAKEEPGHGIVLETMKNAVALCRLRRRLASVTSSAAKRKLRPPTLKYLNISSIAEEEQGQIKQTVLLSEQTKPLAIIEMADIPWEDFQMMSKLCGAVGWKEQWEDKRVWVERRL